MWKATSIFTRFAVSTAIAFALLIGIIILWYWVDNIIEVLNTIPDVTAIAMHSSLSEFFLIPVAFMLLASAIGLFYFKRWAWITYIAAISYITYYSFSLLIFMIMFVGVGPVAPAILIFVLFSVIPATAILLNARSVRKAFRTETKHLIYALLIALGLILPAIVTF